MDALWPGLPDHRRPFEVVVTAPRADGGEPLVPRALPPEVLGCWSADQVIVSAVVLASRADAAVATVTALIPELTCAAGAEVKVRAADAASNQPRLGTVIEADTSGRLDRDDPPSGGGWPGQGQPLA